jgi:DNA-binding MarR family transcriptional regulator
MRDLVDDLLGEWAQQRPELDCGALGVVVRVQLLAKLLCDSAEESLAEFGLKLWEYDVLSALRRQGKPYEMLASELARDSLLTSGTVTTRIDGLEARSLVQRRPDQNDRRTINIRLTKQGLGVINDAIGTRISSANNQLRCLTNTERHQVSAALRKVLQGMSDQQAAA